MTEDSKNIFFSFIIPCYNREEFIESAIKSIGDQNFDSYEIIIVDDGSQDNTEEIIKSLVDKPIIYIKTTNQERGAARNLGLRNATGSYVNYFDSDDIMSPCLRNVHDFILKEGSPAIVFGSIENISDREISVGTVSRAYPDFKRNILHNNFLACGSVFIRKDIALAFAFSENRKLSGTEDWELWLRMFTQHEFKECPYVIFQQRDHASRSLNQMNAENVLQREQAFIESIQNDVGKLQKRFTQTELNLLIADRFTLIALAQIENKNRKKALDFIRKGILKSWRVVGRKRFWALVKKLLFL